MAKIGFVNLGCPKNLVDSEVMIGRLLKDGHSLTNNSSEADVIVVNTCGFIEESKRESIETVLHLAKLKKSGRCKRLVVTGCLAERYPNEIQSELHEVDAILGINQIDQISRAVSGEHVPAPNSFNRNDADLYLYDHNTPRTLITPFYSAYIKIAEGCDHNCAFCIIPKLRGAFRSRTIESLTLEARSLAARGVTEITLVSQDTTSFGIDRGMKDGLARLLESLAGVDGIRWIRFLYAHPNMVSDRLLSVISAHQEICSYIDLPFQHASARILKSMRRRGTRASFTRKIEHIRASVPGITIRTTCMVGFPGETEADFLELKRFVRDLEFDRLGVFAYSDEEGTKAYELKEKVPAGTAHRRRKELMAIQARIARSKNKNLIGREFPVLIEGLSNESELLLQGRLESQAPEIDGVCLINDSEVGGLKPGEYRTIRITQELGHDVLGTVVR